MMNNNEAEIQKIKQSLKARKTQIKIQANKIEQALQNKLAKKTKNLTNRSSTAHFG